ncbi:MAG: RNA methyltransferase [Lachnospiraceae bacterium]|nr:RNA methyltransferase [Lachnospiraceae bacterium]
MLNIIEITDFKAPELDIFARLKENQLQHYLEPAPGLFIAESPNVIERALNSGCKPYSILVEQTELAKEALTILARCGNVPVYTASSDVLTNLTGFQLTRGLLCAMYRPMLPSVETICNSARRIAVLENVMNPTNVGAIFRSAAALGMDAVLLTQGCSDPLYRRCTRVSMGTVFQIPWTYLPKPVNNTQNIKKTETSAFTKASDLSDFSYVRLLKQYGFTTVAMALKEDSTSVENPFFSTCEKLAIILGTEGTGLCDETISSCDYTVMIPMAHGVDSLNVAAASAVAFWQLGKH